MKPIGGTELLYNNLLKYTGQGWQEKVNLVPSVCRPQVLDPNRLNVMWQHLSYDQENVQLMSDPNFVNSVDRFIYVSNWQLNQFQQRFPIAFADNTVIRNAIEPIEFLEKPNDKIRLIYTSMPFRGLEVLMMALDIMKRDDIEVLVYSSNIIYGKNYYVQNSDWLFHRCKNTPCVKYMGFAMNKAIRKAVQSAHILAYPSIFEETSCLSAIEAGAAGCKIVTTNYGALPETCDQWATYVPYSADYRELAENYAQVLNSTIDNYCRDNYTLKQQSDWFNQQYSWLSRAEEWNNYFNKICEK